VPLSQEVACCDHHHRRRRDTFNISHSSLGGGLPGSASDQPAIVAHKRPRATGSAPLATHGGAGPARLRGPRPESQFSRLRSRRKTVPPLVSHPGRGLCSATSGRVGAMPRDHAATERSAHAQTTGDVGFRRHRCIWSRVNIGLVLVCVRKDSVACESRKYELISQPTQVDARFW
jgi:hypothetical protein